jgi:dipeptidyl aminopeptidase/acylaminoacyl peptidase
MKNLRCVAVAGVVAVGVWVVGAGLGLVAQEPTSQGRDVGHPAAKRAMTFADLMAMKRVSDPQVSPSGKWVMFSVTDVSLEKNTKVNHLWVVSLGGGGGTNAGILPSGQNDKQKQATATTEILTGGQNDASKEGGGQERQVTLGDGESNGRFSPDGKWLSYSAKGQIYVAAWDEAAGTVGAARELTRVEGGADGAEWSPDSKRLMFVAGVWPECSVKGLDPTHGDGAAMNGAPGGGGGTNTGILRSAQNDNSTGEVGVSGTRVVAAWKGAEPAGWVEEDACDKAKDEAAEKTPVKGQVWDGLLYRHWDHYTGAKRSHVLVVSADGSGVRDLTPATVVGDAETPTFSLGGPLGYAWAPDSKEIAYVTNLDAVPAASTNNDVFTLRLDEAGAKAEKVSTSPGSDDGPAYSPDGKWLAFRSQARGGFESDLFRLMVFDRGKKTVKDVMPKFDRWVDEFTWTSNSKTIYFAAGDAGAEPIFRTRLDGTNIERFFGIGEFGDLHLGAGTPLVATQVTVDHTATIVVVPDGGFRPAFFMQDRVFSKPAKCPVGVICDSSSRIENTKLLADPNADLFAKLEFGQTDGGVALESFWFDGAEGTKVQGFIMRPPGFDAGKKYPVKFLMHGGPQTAWGDAWSYRWNWELMAANGYVVVGINRRGSTGYGQKFVDEVSGDWGGRAYEDLMKGLDYAEAHYSFIDKTRECALGASYGGFMADWVLTHTDRFKCIVTHDGMYDPVAAYGSTEEMWFNEWEFRRPEDFPKGWDGFGAGYDPMGRLTKTNAGVSPLRPAASGRDDGVKGRAASGRDDGVKGPAASGRDDGVKGAAASGRDDGRPAQPWRYAGLAADQDPFRKWSPMLHIEDAKTPTLVIHSQKDMRLDVSQGMELFTALQRLGVPSKMLYFPDEGHWILKPQNAEVWNEVVGDWCDRWTKTGKYAEK